MQFKTDTNIPTCKGLPLLIAGERIVTDYSGYHTLEIPEGLRSDIFQYQNNDLSSGAQKIVQKNNDTVNHRKVKPPGYIADEMTRLKEAGFEENVFIPYKYASIAAFTQDVITGYTPRPYIPEDKPLFKSVLEKLRECFRRQTVSAPQDPKMRRALVIEVLTDQISYGRPSPTKITLYALEPEDDTGKREFNEMIDKLKDFGSGLSDENLEDDFKLRIKNGAVSRRADKLEVLIPPQDIDVTSEDHPDILRENALLGLVERTNRVLWAQTDAQEPVEFTPEELIAWLQADLERREWKPEKTIAPKQTSDTPIVLPPGQDEASPA